MVKKAKTSATGAKAEPSSARESILDAAEISFGQLGYDGASMREISAAAGVAQALVHYHFQTKERLYEAVFERRSTAASGHRGQLLSALLREKAEPTLEDVLGVLCIPHRESARPDAELAHYLQLVASLGVSSDDRSKELVARYFDPIAQRFIDAFLRVVPELRPDQAVWAYLFAIGSRMQAQATNGRAARLGKARKLAPKDPLTLLVPFVAGGIRAMVSAPKNGRG